jgi:arsenite-transporting ATPase
MAPLLKDPKRSSIRIVLNPERMVINESQRLYTYLNLFGFPVDAVIANRVLPPEARSRTSSGGSTSRPATWRRRGQSFEPLPLLPGALFDREMVGLPLLDELAREVFGARDPSSVFFEEMPIEVKKEGAATRCTSAALRREGPHPGVDEGRGAGGVRRQPAARTCCCRARSRRASCWAPRSRSSACGWASERRRRMPDDGP